jgi:hypothetical protein
VLANGSGSELVVAVVIASVLDGSSPFVSNGIAVDGVRLFWSEVAADRIRMATPK